MNVDAEHLKMTRRAMLSRTVEAAAATAGITSFQALNAAPPDFTAIKEPAWDMHCHLTGVDGTPEERLTQLLEYADRVAIERLVIFLGLGRLHDPPPEQVRRHNDYVLRALSHRPDRAFGFAYLNPKYVEESIRELDRCVRDGPMVGIKLWIATRCNDPCLDPIVRRAVKLKAVVLQHVWFKTTGNYPTESTPTDLAELAARHPDASFIAAHVGGNWECGLRAIRATKNVWAGISGSAPAAGMVEMAVRELGAERVMYGSDGGGRSFASQLSKVHGADIPQSAKRLILRENIRGVLRPILASKGIRV